jgi:hypothetical protein
MKPIEPTTGFQFSTLTYGPSPDVPWGQHGIDALLWADPPPPYETPKQRFAAADPQPAQIEAAS